MAAGDRQRLDLGIVLVKEVSARPTHPRTPLSKEI
jgi:hypothetical protein